MKIKKYKFEKVAVEEQEFILPTETKYYFETHIRRSICVIPVWTKWNKEHYQKEEEIYEYDFICVYQDFIAKIEKITIGVSTFEEHYHNKDGYDLIKFLIDGADEYSARTEEQFNADFNDCLNKMKQNLTCT